ncbi:MAG: YraN family protein [Acidaminococcus intestini]|uniref:UPF0102 protein KHX13_04100 n=1 Tax=Acidaminococcus intestini TaxID=187327 RepID=A0A943ED68_9FIRM|nr:YraN family protein [Acidaminococcus intestini]
MHERTRFGRWGERAAAAYLRHQGYIIEAQNYSSSHGKLDLVARKGHLLVFVEVKSRRTDVYGRPRDAVTEGKASHIRETAYDYLQDHKRPGDRIRYDVIEIMMLFGHFQLNHLENYL